MRRPGQGRPQKELLVLFCSSSSINSSSSNSSSNIGLCPASAERRWGPQGPLRCLVFRCDSPPGCPSACLSKLSLYPAPCLCLCLSLCVSVACSPWVSLYISVRSSTGGTAAATSIGQSTGCGLRACRLRERGHGASWGLSTAAARRSRICSAAETAAAWGQQRPAVRETAETETVAAARITPPSLSSRYPRPHAPLPHAQLAS